MIKHVYVSQQTVRRAARTAADVSQSVSAGPVMEGASQAAAAVTGGESAAAFSEVSRVLEARLAAFRVAVQGWSDDVEAALAAYEASDDATTSRLSRVQWQPV